MDNITNFRGNVIGLAEIRFNSKNGALLQSEANDAFETRQPETESAPERTERAREAAQDPEPLQPQRHRGNLPSAN